jgi:hypothetical protein
MANIHLATTDVTLDFNAILADGGNVTFQSVLFDVNALTIRGHDAVAVFNGHVTLDGCEVFSDYIQEGCEVQWQNTSQTQAGGNPTMHITNQLNQPASLWAWGGGTNGNVIAQSLAAPVATQTTVNFYGFSAAAGTCTKTVGAGGTLPVLNANYGDLPENASITAVGGEGDPMMRFSWQFNNIAPNPTAIAGTGNTTVELAIPVQLRSLFAGAHPIELWHMLAMPSGSWGAIDSHGALGVWYSFYTNAGVPTVRVHFANASAGFNITDAINLNVSGYMPRLLAAP